MAGGGADADAGHSGGGDGLSDASVCGELSLFEKKLLLRCQKQESLFVRYLIQMGEMYEMRRECLGKRHIAREVLAVLTDKEYEMVLLINQHQTNREIAEKMFLSEEVSNNMSNRFIQNFRLKGIPEQRESSCYSCWKRIPTIGE